MLIPLPGILIALSRCLAVALFAQTVESHFVRKGGLRARHLEAERAWKTSVAKREAITGTTNAGTTFSNPKATEFYVDGKSLPEVEFDVGPSWSGLLPISSNADETRKLFFWFFPAEKGANVDDLIFWTNGGPGCSSLEGILQENGPFSWSYGQAKPTPNKYSWTKLANVLWVEQPVGTGFSQGTPNIKNEDELAAQLVGFLQQFLEVFHELKGKKLYLTGESYAGTYIPYIANYIYNHKEALSLNLEGIWFGDPVFSYTIVQQQIPAVGFVEKYRNVFAFNETFMKQLEATAKKCGYYDYIAKHVTYPPKGPLPLPGNSFDFESSCDVWAAIFDAALIINPAFNIYRIFDTYPILWDVLGFPGSFHQNQTLPLYFARSDVMKAIHAPADATWVECSDIHVFPNGDQSEWPVFTVLPSVIEKNSRTVIVHGLADFMQIAEGTRIVIQNMTWGNQQGFQEPIATDSFLVDGVGAMGTSHLERKLAYVEVVLSGHMVPQFSPVAAFQTMEYLLGMREMP